MRKVMAVGAAVLLSAVVGQANFLWNSGAYFYNSAGTSGSWLVHEPLNSEGVFVQLIRDVDGDGADPLVPSGTGVSGDDVVWAVSWFGDDGGDGDSPPPYDGQWWQPNTGQSMTAGATEDEWKFYARVFDSPAASWNGTSTEIPLTWYFQGPIWTYDNDFPAPEYNMTLGMVEGTTTGWFLDYVSTGNQVAIPEPTAFALGIIGLLLVRAFRRVK